MYKNKYMKYKAKYLKLMQQIGGMEKSITSEDVKSNPVIPESVVTASLYFKPDSENKNYVYIFLEDETSISITTSSISDTDAWGSIDTTNEEIEKMLKGCIILSIDQINRIYTDETDETEKIIFDIAIKFMDKDNRVDTILLPVKYKYEDDWKNYDIWLDVDINIKK